MASPDNPTPVWLKDQLLNQWSHFHMLMWYKDGRLREYEAWSCDDVDRCDRWKTREIFTQLAMLFLASPACVAQTVLPGMPSLLTSLFAVLALVLCLYRAGRFLGISC